MLIEHLAEQLKSIQPDLAAIDAYWESAGLEDRYQQLHERINAEDFWQAPDQIAVSKEYQALKTQRETYLDLKKRFEDNKEFLSLFEDNAPELTPLATEIGSLCRAITRFKVELLLNKPEDHANCFFDINAGAGGTESQDWASMLLRMYTRFCERHKIAVDVMDYQAGEEAGIKSATLFLRGKNAYGLLKSEGGIHRLVRISPFDANQRRHTSFAGVTISPEVADEKIQINENDLRIDTYRAGGKGGQHVNKTDSAVRITHIPSGIVVQCQNERSQLQNKQTAMKMLMSRLVEKQEQEKRAKEAAVEKKKIEWGSQIRSYVLHPYKMVKDHRTEHESPQPDLVLDGELMPFIEAYLTSPYNT
jgi:peptide chain release factor 2